VPSDFVSKYCMCAPDWLRATDDCGSLDFSQH
jgi:hypothetical protein